MEDHTPGRAVVVGANRGIGLGVWRDLLDLQPFLSKFTEVQSSFMFAYIDSRLLIHRYFNREWVYAHV